MRLHIAALVGFCAIPLAPTFTFLPRVALLSAQQETFDEGIERITTTLSSSLDGRTVAVLDFPALENRTTSLSRLVSEQLTTELVQRMGGRARIVERRQIRQVQEELEFMGTELTPSQIDSLGRLLGTDAIIIGSAGAIGEQIVVNVRAVGLPGWEVLGADRMSVRASPDLLHLATMEIAPANKGASARDSIAVLSGGSPVGSPPEPRVVIPTAHVQTAGTLRVEISDCTQRGATLTCDMVFTDQEDGRLALMTRDYYTGAASRIIHEDGQEYQSEQARLGSQSYNHQATMNLIAAVPARGGYRFVGVPRGTTIPVLEIVIWYQEDFQVVRFRNIPMRVTNP